MPRRASALGVLAVLGLLVGGCGGGAEGACAAPRLGLSSESVKAGEQITVTWEGLLECEGESIFPPDGKIPVAIAKAPPDLEEPFEDPSPIVDKWAEIDGEVGSEGEEPSVTASIPSDLEAGEYYLYVADPRLFLSQSPPFEVVEG